MEKRKTATILGSTGLIGSHILKLLNDDDHFESIRLITRRPLSYDHPKLDIRVIDFEDESQFREAIRGTDVIFCAVGTTNKKVEGDKEAYRKVDFDIPVNAARHGAETGCEKYLLVSAIGADVNSKIFYSRLKGEVEEAVASCGIPSVSIFQPSMLLGDRDESRPAESIGQTLMKGLAFLIPSKYKPIKASDVAEAMVSASKRNITGTHAYDYSGMKELISKGEN